MLNVTKIHNILFIITQLTTIFFTFTFTFTFTSTFTVTIANITIIYIYTFIIKTIVH